MNNFFYKVNDVDYEVEVIYKRIKNVHYRFKDNKFVVSCNRWTTKHFIIKGLDKYATKLIKSNAKESPTSEEYFYLFGNKYDLSYPGKITISNYPEIIYKSIDELKKKLKPIFIKIITSRVRYYESIMNLPSYKVGVRDMKSRYGSNSRYTKHLNFAFILIHYSMPIIDSVVVHELAHILVYDHSKKFYDVVYKYCPDYDKYRKMLIKGIYHD